MTAGPATSRLQDNFLAGIGGGLVAIVTAGYVCKWAGVSQETTTGVLALAGAAPPAVGLRIKSRRRDQNVDIARIQRGELRRPVGLVVMLLAAVILLLDSAFGSMMSGISSVLQHLVSAGKIEMGTARVLAPVVGVLPVILGMCVFIVASYASHYFAKRAYLWTAAAVGCASAGRELVLLAFSSSGPVKSFVTDTYGSLGRLLAATVVSNLGFLVICLVGVWLGRRYHDEFLAKKLARMERTAAREAAKQQSTPQSQPTAMAASAQDSSSSAPQISEPKLATLVGRPNDSPSAPDIHPTRDHFREIEKLAHLRDKGALTEEEFQAKKTEILCRI
jgi:hypothetical protein